MHQRQTRACLPEEQQTRAPVTVGSCLLTVPEVARVTDTRFHDYK